MYIYYFLFNIMGNERIFICIASYQDVLLKTTILDSYLKAKNPENLVYGVCDQSDSGLKLDISEIEFKNQIRYIHYPTKKSQGVCWARKNVQNMYENEKYYCQIDSHMLFDYGWDEYLKGYLNKIKQFNELPIISSYPRGFEVIDFENKEFQKSTESNLTHTLNFVKNKMFVNKTKFCKQQGNVTKIEIVHGYLIAAGCIFSYGNFIKDVPYNDKYYFEGEELDLAIRAFTNGYDVFHIPDVPIYHLYNDKPIKKIVRKLHWEEDLDREVKFYERNRISFETLKCLFNGKLNGIYGLGNKRTMEEFKFITGVDFVNETIISSNKAFSNEFLISFDWKENIEQIKKIATMSVLPKRIHTIDSVIESIIDDVDELHINIPYICKRTNEKYDVPKIKNEKVKIFRTDDIGALTKILPTLERVIEIDKAYIFVIDDDQIYKEKFVDKLISKSREGYEFVSRRSAGFEGFLIHEAWAGYLIDNRKITKKFIDDMIYLSKNMLHGELVDDLIISLLIKTHDFKIFCFHEIYEEIVSSKSIIEITTSKDGSLKSFNDGNLKRYRESYNSYIKLT